MPSVWQQLQGQMYLGNAEFVEVVGEKIGTRLSVDAGYRVCNAALQRRRWPGLQPCQRATRPSAELSSWFGPRAVMTPRISHLISCRYADRKETDDYFISP